MKNRILWIFESGEEPNGAENEAAQINANHENQAGEAFVALPWALFGSLAETEREQMQDIYRAAYERTQANFEERHEEVERFERLLAGVSAHKLTEDY